MQLKAYLTRIGWTGTAEPTAATLGQLVRAHNHNIPFENLDVQLGKPLTTSVADAYEKLVSAGRGGWCYEQNGVFGWALEQIGFGGSLLAPIPLREAAYEHEPFKVGLRKLAGEQWQFWESVDGSESNFDFFASRADEDAMSLCCDYLQSSPDSGFVQKLVCQIRQPTAHLTLRGRVFSVLSATGKRERLLESADELVALLADPFGLQMPDAAKLWPSICEQHEQWVQSERDRH